LDRGYSQLVVSERTDVSLRSVKRIAKEPAVESLDDAAERKRRGIGRPSVVGSYRRFINRLLEKNPQISTAEIIRRVEAKGYDYGKSAMYVFVRQIRLASKGAIRRTAVRRTPKPTASRRKAVTKRAKRRRKS
jgi:hypothetical protein